MSVYDVIIIGAGPAGLSAGLYAGRLRLNTLIMEKEAVGGQIILSPTIENYPGYPEGVHTHELMEGMRRQVEDLGIKIDLQEVVRLDTASEIKKVFSTDKVFEAKALIIATGSHPKRLGALGEEKFLGKGVSYCGICDGPLFKDKDIVVVGGGDRAIEETIFLAKYASHVSLIHRRSHLRGSKILEEEASKCDKIDFILDSVVEEIKGQEKVSAIKIKNLKDSSLRIMDCQGVFIFVGIEPNTHFLKGLLNLDKDGFIITDEDMRTSCAGIFAAGDCRAKSFRQVITACGDGAIAASAAKQFLSPY